MRNLSNKSTEYLKCVKCQVCAILLPFPILPLPRASRAVKISRRLKEIIGASWSYSGLSLTNSENGAKESKNVLCQSNASYQSTSRQNSPTILKPHILDLIRHCGRRSDEQEARRLYLAYGIDFREYCRAYRAGRQETKA